MSDCPSCGTSNPEPARFCMACGAVLVAEAPEPFRRTVTILFSDVVGSTALGERLDPEIVTAVMTEYFEAMKPVVERHGGSVAKFIGDAVSPRRVRAGRSGCRRGDRDPAAGRGHGEPRLRAAAPVRGAGDGRTRR